MKPIININTFLGIELSFDNKFCEITLDISFAESQCSKQ